MVRFDDIPSEERKETDRRTPIRNKITYCPSARLSVYDVYGWSTVIWVLRKRERSVSNGAVIEEVQEHTKVQTMIFPSGARQL